MSESISLNKYISSTGMCSRREADKLIEQGRVVLNGQIAKKGNRVQSGDDVEVDGQRISKKARPVYIALHKPPGITCTTDRRDKTNIVDFVNHKQRIFPIGRLDKASSGLILMTNDGDIVNSILRVENNHEKVYIVKVNKDITTEFIKRMSSGLPILGQRTKGCKVKMISKTVFEIILTQGLNRQIRRMCEYLGYDVVTLKRIRIMNIQLGKLPKGHWRDLSAEELKGLRLSINS